MESVSSVSSVDQKLINRMVRIKLFFLQSCFSLSSTNDKFHTNISSHADCADLRRMDCIASLAADGYAECLPPDGHESASDA